MSPSLLHIGHIPVTWHKPTTHAWVHLTHETSKKIKNGGGSPWNPNEMSYVIFLRFASQSFLLKKRELYFRSSREYFSSSYIFSNHSIFFPLRIEIEISPFRFSSYFESSFSSFFFSYSLQLTWNYFFLLFSFLFLFINFDSISFSFFFFLCFSHLVYTRTV